MDEKFIESLIHELESDNTAREDTDEKCENPRENMKKENVNHPRYYNRGNIEAIDVIEDWNLNFSLGSAVKYICRLGAKDNEIQELDKAIWYLTREKEARLKKKK